MNPRFREIEMRRHARVGWAPPKKLIKLIARCAPFILLVYSTDMERWVLLSKNVGQGWTHFRTLEDEQGNAVQPTITNTIIAAKLAEMVQSERDMDRFLADMDKRNEEATARRSAKIAEAQTEPLDRLGHAMGLSRSYRAQPLWRPT